MCHQEMIVVHLRASCIFMTHLSLKSHDTLPAVSRLAVLLVV